MPKKIICVVSGKGGVGKSSVAVNLGVLLAKAGARTLLIDADLYNPCIFFHLGLSPQSAGLGELLENAAQIEEALPIHPISGLRVISSSIQNYGTINVSRLDKLVQQLNYEYIIFDCPPGFSPLIEEIVSISNNIIILMTPDMPSCTAALKLFKFIKNQRRGEAKRFEFFLNRVTRAPYEVHPQEIEDLFNSELSVLIPEDSNVPKSIAAKTPIVLMAPHSTFSKKLYEFAPKLLLLRDHPLEKGWDLRQKYSHPSQLRQRSGLLNWLAKTVKKMWEE